MILVIYDWAIREERCFKTETVLFDGLIESKNEYEP